MKQLLVPILALFVLASCTELRIDPDCYPKNKIIHEAADWHGRVVFNTELNVWMINHFVPGTIDSYYTGVVCDIPEAFKEENLEVIFSGYLKDDRGKIQPSSLIGGQEFFFLELLSIELAE